MPYQNLTTMTAHKVYGRLEFTNANDYAKAKELLSNNQPSEFILRFNDDKSVINTSTEKAEDIETFNNYLIDIDFKFTQVSYRLKDTEYIEVSNGTTTKKVILPSKEVSYKEVYVNDRYTLKYNGVSYGTDIDTMLFYLNDKNLI